MINHLWYLSSEQVGLSFFDDTIEGPVKRRMVKRMITQLDTDEEDCEKREIKPTIGFKEVDQLVDKEIDHFVLPQTIIFFKDSK